MKTPIFNRKHLTEYIGYGAIAAFLYLTTLFFYLQSNRYENTYYLYVGNGLFLLTIFLYNIKLLYRSYDKRRAVSMLIAGHLTTLAGVTLTVVLSLIMALIYFPALFSEMPADEVLHNAPANSAPHRPSGLLFMVYINAIICNFAAGAFISIMVSYAGKLNQTKDKPAHLDTEINTRNS